jgi:hypothetical protein
VLGRSLELQLHPVEGKRIVNWAAVKVAPPNLRAGVAGQRNPITLINRLDDERDRTCRSG